MFKNHVNPFANIIPNSRGHGRHHSAFMPSHLEYPHHFSHQTYQGSEQARELGVDAESGNGLARESSQSELIPTDSMKSKRSDYSRDFLKENSEQELTEFEMWEEIAENELDFYTCFALRYGVSGLTHKKTWQLLRSLVLVLFMQGVLPMLMFTYFANHHKVVEDHGMEFRVIGFGLYGYAIWEMYNSACDDARTKLLEIIIAHNLNARFVHVLLIGEFTNMFTGFNLTICLFFIFCTSATPIDLILNSLAINFLLEIDSTLIDEDMRKDTGDLFKHITDPEEGFLDNPETTADHCRNHAIQISLQVFMVCRFVLILVLGFVMSLAFFFSEQEMICNNIGFADAWMPFCCAEGITCAGEQRSFENHGMYNASAL